MLVLKSALSLCLKCFFFQMLEGALKHFLLSSTSACALT